LEIIQQATAMPADLRPMCRLASWKIRCFAVTRDGRRILRGIGPASG
jgi:hypothetical protein